MPFRLFLYSLLSFLIAENALAETKIPLEKFLPGEKVITVEKLSDGSLSVLVPTGTEGTLGASILPETGDSWDFSGASRIEAVVRNNGEADLPINLRVDNAGHWKTNPWSSESVRLKPGNTKTLVVFFGYSFGFQEGFALDRSQVTQLLFFTEGAERDRSFVIESIAAKGEPAETPEIWMNQNEKISANELLLGPDKPLSSAQQLSGSGGAEVIADTNRFTGTFNAPDQSIRFQPESTFWDLRSANSIAIDVLNNGTEAIGPGFRLDSKGGTVTKQATLEPGKVTTVSIPFSAGILWDAATPDESKGFISSAVRALVIESDPGAEKQLFTVGRITVTAPDAELPEWLGQRPPVKGEWINTFAEEFDTLSVDSEKWNIYSMNYWDKRSHFSSENVIVGDGVATLRFEKKTGHHNDDPKEEETDYATGFLDTYDKWTQTYGYFEARMKLPSAPGLWPAFWMMPDRGPPHIERWKREQTTEGGMEFDIMEYLSGWGPYRYNVAFHWDGYEKQHQNAGTSGIYMETDAEGFITAGLLWLPGKAVYYCNGRIVGEWESDRVSNVPSVLRFTHVSGGWDNQPLSDAALPDDFVIDYVRCWQRADLVE